MKIPSLTLLSFLALVPGPSAPAFGQDAGSVGESPSASLEAAGELHLAPVIIDGETLIRVRGIAAFPAERRARAIEERIRAFAADKGLAAESLTLDDKPGNTSIMAGNQRIMAVLDEDAAVEMVGRSRLAELYRNRIAEAVKGYRNDRQPRVLWLNALRALAATLAMLVIAYAISWIFRRSKAALERRVGEKLKSFQDRAFQIVRAEKLWQLLAGFLNFARIAVVLTIAYFYLDYVLALFPWTRGLSKSLMSIAIDPLRTMGLGFIDMIPNLVFLAILFVVTRYMVKVARLFFQGISAGTLTLRNFEPEWGEPTYRLVRTLLIACAAVVAYPYIPGSGSEAFKGVSLFAGIVFSLGSSSLIGNLIAGYSMTYRRAFRIGDRVKVGEYFGEVERVRLLVTHLRTPKNEEVVVPNSKILADEVVNYSSLARGRGLILHTTVGIGYETPWRQVEAMLLEAAGRTRGLLREPAPFVHQKALGDFCITYEINVYCDTPHGMISLYSELHRNILDVFNEYGVQIMTPAYEADPERPKVVPREQWYAAPARNLSRDETAG
ncbi:MAG: mechanosensitive ion channel family protein [Rubrivivax sp.]|nr:mechanosensitive ion channel family protein [Rubrivivax sp.]